MTAKDARPLRFDPNNLSQLACPVCRGDLRGGLRPDGTQSDGPQIFCAGCSRAYPIVDGIPILIAERAEVHQSNP
jgi:uncharacterized protein YbaR (Trm112 family)